MTFSDKILLGKITRPFGFDGAVTVKIEKIFQDKIPEFKAVFLEIEGKAVPFIVSSAEKPASTLLRLVFEGYETLEKIREFIGCRIFLPSVRTRAKKGADLSGLTGYKITDTAGGPPGTIQEIIENPGQILLGVQPDEGKYFYVPFHEDLIVKIDNRKKIIIMDLPEGLREINDPVS